MKRVLFLSLLFISMLAHVALSQVISPEGKKTAQSRPVEKRAQGAGTPFTKPSTMPAVEFHLIGKKFTAAKAFGTSAILLEVAASTDIGRLTGTLVVKDAKGVTRGTVAVSQSVQYHSFAVRIDYDEKVAFYRWLKETPADQMRVSVDVKELTAPTEKVIADAAATAPAKPAALKHADRLAYVVDTSGTMLGVYADASAQLKLAVHDLPDGQLFNVYLGGKTVTPLSKSYVPANRETRESLNGLLDQTSPKLGSELEKAVDVACKSQADLIWLITDGDIGSNPDESARKMIAAATASKTRIDCALNFTRPEDAPTRLRLIRICRRTGGRCYDEHGADVTEFYGVDDPAPPTLAKPADAKKQSIFTEK